MITFTRLKDIREDNVLNQKDIANILDVNRLTYSLWELGINIIPIKNLCDFGFYFNYSIDYILGLTNLKYSNFSIQKLNLVILGNNLKNIRIKNKLTQKEIANILNVTQACIARYEKGIIQISTSNLYKFSKRFNISLDKLCTIRSKSLTKA